MGDLIRAARPMQEHFLCLLEHPDAKERYYGRRSLFLLVTMAVINTTLLAYDKKVAGCVGGIWITSPGLSFS